MGLNQTNSLPLDHRLSEAGSSGWSSGITPECAEERLG
jgi:hypothetical protein